MYAPESPSRPAALDHLVYAVPDLPDAVRAFATRAGVVAAPGGRHVGRGTANFLVDLGHAGYLEIIGPDPDEPDRPLELPFGVQAIDAPVLVTWAIWTADIDEAIGRARSYGYDPGDAAAMSRRTGSGELLEWRLTQDTIGDGGGVVPFLIDWGMSPHPTASRLPAVSLLSLAATSPHPDLARSQLRALDTEMSIDYGPTAKLSAVLLTPRGELQL